MSSEWFGAAELAGLAGLPKTERRTREKAKREDWKARRRSGRGGGYEYHISALPEAARAALAAAQTRIDSKTAQAGHAEAARLKLTEEQQRQATLSTAADGLARLATLTGDARTRAEARLAILDALNAFRNRSDQSKTQALQRFVTYYNDGVIDCADWIRDQLGTISAASLYRWQTAAQKEGAGRLAGNYGNRKGSSRIDSQPEILEYVKAMLGQHPDVRPAHLHQAIHTQFSNADNLTLPSQTACARWLRRWKTQNRSLHMALSNPDGWKSNFMPAFGSASEDVERINQRWELDSTPADVLLTDGRHSVIGVIDIHTRRAKLLVSRTSTSTAVAATVRRAILDWGVPESVKHDNGSDYVSHHMNRVWELLDVEQHICNPYSGWEKPHIERFFRTFSHDLVELLPGYAGHNVGERQAIEARKSFADRLMARGEVIEIRMDAAELQAYADRWLASVYEQRPHSGLDNQTPMQRAAGQRVRRIDDERMLDVLLAQAPGNGQRTIGKKGISIDSRWYIAPEMGDHIGEPVQVLFDETDMGRIHVFSDLGEGWTHLCVAECPELTGISRQEVAQKTRAMRTKAVQRQRAEMRRAAKQFKTADVVDQILDEREQQTSRVTALPGRSDPAASGGIDAARGALDALDAVSTPAPVNHMDAETRERLSAQIAAEDAEREERMTPRELFRAWQTMIAGTEPDDKEREEWRLYEKSNAFRVRYEAAYGDEFSGHGPGQPHEKDAATLPQSTEEERRNAQ